MKHAELNINIATVSLNALKLKLTEYNTHFGVKTIINISLTKT